MDPLYIGVNLPAKLGVSNPSIVDNALATGYDFITARLTTRTYRAKIETPVDDACTSPQPPLNGDVAVDPGPHVAHTVALASPWLELDARDAAIADRAAQVLEHELRYATFLGMHYVVVNGPSRRTQLARYSRALTRLLREFRNLKILIHFAFAEDSSAGTNELSTWEAWDAVRSACDYSSNLRLALEVPDFLLSAHLIDRWFCEPVSMIIVSASSFVPNPTNYPVLTKHLQRLLLQFARTNPLILLKDVEGTCDASLNDTPKVEMKGGPSAYLIYLRHLLASPPPRDAFDKFSSVYGDLLQAPLQPLTEHLDCATYEVFEADAVKYRLYEQAIGAALDNELAQIDEDLEVIVAGAGRGPLVDAVLSAATSRGRKLHIYALEKNPGAAAYLHARRKVQWRGAVSVVCVDMREWEPPQAPYLVVSELLGSLGDSELSPECLVRLEKSLAFGGIMIPASYTAYVAPVFAPKMYTAARAAKLAMPKEPAIGHAVRADNAETAGGLQQPYVVQLEQAQQVAPSQPLWSFEHPNLRNSMRRCAKLSFEIKHSTKIHGLAGYFEAVLYRGIELSTRPETRSRSEGLISWFPLWFPLVQPMAADAKAEFLISMWRETAKDTVWYEWIAEVAGPASGAMRSLSLVHNSEGKFYSMRM